MLYAVVCRTLVHRLVQEIHTHHTERLNHIRVLQINECEDRRWNIVRKVVCHTAQIPLHLLELAPLLILERVTELKNSRATTLALEDIKTLVIRLYGSTQSLDTLGCVVWILEIDVVRHAIQHVQLLLFLQDLEHLSDIVTHIVLAKSKCQNLSLRILLADNLTSVDKEICNNLWCVSLLTVWLIPHLVHHHLVAIVAYDSANVVIPRLHSLLVCPNRRVESNTILAIERISVAKAQPRFHTLLDNAINVLVEPSEVVDTLLLLTLCPTTLQTSPTYSERTEKMLVVCKCCIVAIESLATDRPTSTVCVIWIRHIESAHLWQHRVVHLKLVVCYLWVLALWWNIRHCHRHNKCRNQK